VKRARYQRGSVVFDKRRGTWNYIWWDSGRRRSRLIGDVADFRTKASAQNAAEAVRSEILTLDRNPASVTVQSVIEHYRNERMPKRYSTRRAYESWIKNHIAPKWGHFLITDLQARYVELWLRSLDLSPRSKSSIRGLLRMLWDHAMWRGGVLTQRNPMQLVNVPSASKRLQKPKSLTVQEFRRFVVFLNEPFRTIALVCVALGLRISECLGLKWLDVDWLNHRLSIERAVVRQRVGDTKTAYSNQTTVIDAAMLEVLRAWKSETNFSEGEDWMFASPVQLGRLPWSADAVNDAYRKAASVAGMTGIGTHTMRHTYRSWLDAVGAPIAVQQKLMRHADVRTTMNVYGDVVTDEMTIVNSKVADLALNGWQVDRKPS